MKRLLFILILTLSTLSSFSQIKVGDVDMNGTVSISDITVLTQNILEGKEAIYDPYSVDNTKICGRWLSDSGTLDFSENGDCKFSDGIWKSYCFMPQIGRLLVFQKDDNRVVWQYNAAFLPDGSLALGDTRYFKESEEDDYIYYCPSDAGLTLENFGSLFKNHGKVRLTSSKEYILDPSKTGHIAIIVLPKSRTFDHFEVLEGGWWHWSKTKPDYPDFPDGYDTYTLGSSIFSDVKVVLK